MSVLNEAEPQLRTKTRTKAPARESLTTRLLALAAGFVVLTESLVFLPTIAEFRQEWLVNRFDTGELAALALPNSTNPNLANASGTELLRAAAITSVIAKSATGDRLLIGSPSSEPAIAIDLERQTLGGSIFDVIETLFAPSGRILAITQRPRSNAAIKLQVTVAEAPLKASLMREIGQVFVSSMLLAIAIGMLIYAALADGFVRPMRRLTRAIMRFRASPEDGSRNLVASGRNDEIGEAEIAFIDMQDTVRQAFLQRERLAQLGLAVSKISHDLRHSLGAAQLVSERLAQVDDAVVRVTAPRLERALERAIGLAESTLQFGKAQEAPPAPELLYLTDALDEAAGEALNGLYGVTWVCQVPQTTDCEVDPDQLHRILSNLIRNAGQAIMATRKTGTITASAQVRGAFVDLDIADTGPGLPRGVADNLFAPFAGSGLSGGTGLGLAIARDLARMNGGDIALVSTSDAGTCFRVTLRGVGEG
jgi:signal transduction histidine kinase